jgi:hypothetical protein
VSAGIGVVSTWLYEVGARKIALSWRLHKRVEATEPAVAYELAV